jgi:hypothetical protein
LNWKELVSLFRTTKHSETFSSSNIKKNKVDLHIHTTASDGFYSPQEVINKAASAGLNIISITDHDTVDAIDEAMYYADKVGIEVITGIELSAEYDNREVHILGYFFDHKDKDFLLAIDTFKKSRFNRVIKFIAKLNEQGIMINLEDVLTNTKSSSLGRPHIAQAIITRGYASSFYEVFAKYLGNNSPAFVKKDFLAPETAFELINRAGGISIIAHPGAISESSVKHFIKLGVNGFEVNHPSHSSLQKKYYSNIVSKHNLIGTSGSDFHGGKRSDETNLGNYFLSPTQFNLIRARVQNLI